MYTDMSVFMGTHAHIYISSLNWAHVPMNTDMSMSMGTQSPMYTDMSVFMGHSRYKGNIYKLGETSKFPTVG